MEEKNPSDPRGPSLPGRGADALWRCNMKVPPQFSFPVSCAKEHADAFRRGKYKTLFHRGKIPTRKKKKDREKDATLFFADLFCFSLCFPILNNQDFFCSFLFLWWSCFNVFPPKQTVGRPMAMLFLFPAHVDATPA